MLSIDWPSASVVIVLLLCVASVSKTYIVSKTTETLSDQKVREYSQIINNTNKGLPTVNLKVEVTNETKRK